MYLLLVENNYISSREIKRLFDTNKISCEVVNTSSSEALLDLARKLSPEIVIVDFEFFSDDPVAVIKKLRQYNPGSYIIAFAVTEFYQNLNQAIEAGVNDYLIKPLQQEDVLLRIRIGLQHLKAVTAEDEGTLQHHDVFQNSEHIINDLPGESVDFSSAASLEPQPYINSGKVSYIGRTREKPAAREAGFELFEQSSAEQAEQRFELFSAPDPIDHFEQLVTDAKLLADENPAEAIALLEQALELYKNEYLKDFFSSGSRSLNIIGQHEFYIGAVLDLANLLIKYKEEDRAIMLCEEALQIDYFEESIHIVIIEALLAKGESALALAHYDKIVTAFYREMGLTPSEEMKKIYEKIQCDSDNSEMDLSQIQSGLNTKELPEGAFFCDTEQFCYFYKLEQLRGERSGQSILLCMLALISKDYSKPPVNLMHEVMHNLKNVIMQNLRKGDLITKWNEGQYLLLLPGLNREQAAEVLNRIEHAYSLNHSLQGLALQKKIETIFPLEGDSHFN